MIGLVVGNLGLGKPPSPSKGPRKLSPEEAIPSQLIAKERASETS